MGSSEKTVSNDCIVGKVQRSLLKWILKCMMDVAYFTSGSTLEMMSGYVFLHGEEPGYEAMVKYSIEAS